MIRYFWGTPKTMKKISLVILLCLVYFTSHSQAPVFKPSSLIRHDLEKLKVTARILYVAAHPDDENTRLISYLTKEKKYDVGYLSLTRGDGGQNLIGNEQGEALGIIRTQELLAARRLDGGIQFFTRAYDFGYSKTPEETFKKWGKENILNDVVYVIRMFKPDVIICRFPSTGEGGHGHHTASAILASEAFDAAANPDKFPEQLKYVETWQTKRLLWNTFNFGSTNTTSEDQFKIDVGGFDPLSGKSNGEIASESRSQHRSQAFGTERRRGEQFEYFKTIKGSAPVYDLMDGIPQDWSRFPLMKKFTAVIDKILKKYKENQPSMILPDLIALHKNMSAIDRSLNKPNERLKSKLVELEDIIMNCAGIFVDVITEKSTWTNSDTASIKFQAINRSNADASIGLVSFGDSDWIHSVSSLQNLKLEKNKWSSASIALPLAKFPHYTSPYAHRHGNTLTENNAPLQWKPEYRPEAIVRYEILINGYSITRSQNISYKHTDPSFGEIYQPFVIAPPICMNFTEELYLFNGKHSKKIKLKVKAFSPVRDVIISLEYPNGWNVTEKEKKLSFSIAGEEKEIEFEVIPQINNSNSELKLRAIADINGKRSSWSEHHIRYDHIPEQRWFELAEVKITSVDVKTNTNKIGYIAGAGDKIPEIMSQLGFQVTLLDEIRLISEELNSYDAIITGVRAFNTIKGLKFLNHKLFDYVESGGILVIQYNTNRPLVTEKLGPFPFSISRNRVTEEDADVQFLHKNHPALNYPNRIGPEDFENWVQERGLYFPENIDSNYTSLLRMSDKDSQHPLDNSIILTRYGKGKYVYTGISFFRQLPAGVPGAIRLFVNLISKNEKEIPNTEAINQQKTIQKK